MKELKVAHLTKTYGEKTLFDQISFLIHEKDRIGLIGINGTGKSSLLKILAGKDSGDGDVTAVSYPNGYRIGFLSQSTDFSDGETILEAVFQGESPVIQTVRRYEQALLALTENENDPQTQARFTRAEEQMNENDAWMTDTNAKIIFAEAGVEGAA